MIRWGAGARFGFFVSPHFHPHSCPTGESEKGYRESEEEFGRPSFAHQPSHLSIDLLAG
jgi:hypothetical protein